MTKTTVTPTAPKKAAMVKKPAANKSTHPPTGEMVNAAITALKDKKGSSLQAIKKYIAGTYVIDVDKQSTYIKKYLKSAVENKIIVQTKGTGASGRFKIAAMKAEGEKAAKKPAAKKPTPDKKSAKKETTETVTAAKKPVAKKPATAKNSAPVSPSKAKKGGKAPAAAKPRTPKPKKTTAKGPKTKATKK